MCFHLIRCCHTSVSFGLMSWGNIFSCLTYMVWCGRWEGTQVWCRLCRCMCMHYQMHTKHVNCMAKVAREKSWKRLSGDKLHALSLYPPSCLSFLPGSLSDSMDWMDDVNSWGKEGAAPLVAMAVIASWSELLPCSGLLSCSWAMATLVQTCMQTHVYNYNSCTAPIIYVVSYVLNLGAVTYGCQPALHACKLASCTQAHGGAYLYVCLCLHTWLHCQHSSMTTSLCASSTRTCWGSMCPSS